MGKGPIIVDGNIQKVQVLISKGIGILVRIIDDIGHERATPTEEYHPVLTDAVRCLSASFSALSQTRKDVIRNDLGEPLS